LAKVLSFKIQPQVHSDWCWAAVSASVAAFYNPASPWTQCQVVDKEKGRTDCCANGASAKCNVQWYLEKALTRVKHLNTVTGGASSLPSIKTEVDGDRPLGVRTAWSRGGAHFMVVQGYDEGTRRSPSRTRFMARRWSITRHSAATTRARASGPTPI
jgi:hypothetical protein